MLASQTLIHRARNKGLPYATGIDPGDPGRFSASVVPPPAANFHGRLLWVGVIKKQEKIGLDLE